MVVGKKAAFVEGCEGAQKAKVRTLGFEAEHLSYSAYKQMGHGGTRKDQAEASRRDWWSNCA